MGKGNANNISSHYLFKTIKFWLTDLSQRCKLAGIMILYCWTFSLPGCAITDKIIFVEAIFMCSTIINMAAWTRREYFEHYLHTIPCSYSMTVKLDITRLRQKCIRLYPALIWILTTIVNRHDEFRMNINDRDELILYDNMDPCYTIFCKQSEAFSNIWTQYSDNFTIFQERYGKDVEMYEKSGKFAPKPNIPENSFTISMIPWTSFEAFNLNVPNFKYPKPIFTIGKFWQANKKCLLPLAAQVHHAVCDGFHLCRFINELQEETYNFENE